MKALYGFSLMIIALSMASCVPDSIPLKGTYDSLTLEITSTKSVDNAWLAITDLFTTQGLGIESIDKKEGLIISKETSFIAAYTYEDENGQLEASNAWVVLRRAESNEEQKWIPKSIYSTWSIKINTEERGIVIKIDPVVICTYYPNRFTSVETHEQSTGKLEAQIKTALSSN